MCADRGEAAVAEGWSLELSSLLPEPLAGAVMGSSERNKFNSRF